MKSDNSKIFEELNNKFRKHYNLSKEVSENFSQMLWQDPEKALDSLLGEYDKSLDRAYTDSKTGENVRGFIEAIAGGPHEAIPSSFYNCVGEIYPVLNRNLRNKALDKILGVLDMINSRYITISHTPYIKEPLLLSDISILRALYWPGLEDGENLIKKFALFSDFKFECLTEDGFFKRDKVDSDFIVAYSILRNDICNWGEDYLEVVNKSFLDRVIKGVVGMRFAHYFELKNLSEEEIEGINHEAEDENYYPKIKENLNQILANKISNQRKRLRELLPPSLHKTIDDKLNEQDWVDSFLFRDHKSYLLTNRIKRYLEE